MMKLEPLWQFFGHRHLDVVKAGSRRGRKQYNCDCLNGNSCRFGNCSVSNFQ